MKRKMNSYNVKENSQLWKSKKKTESLAHTSAACILSAQDTQPLAL